MPRAGLSATHIVTEAAGIADTDGIEAVSLARLAGQLGVRVPSLYKHIDGLADLRTRLAVTGVRGLTEAVAAATVGRAGRDALLACCRAYRDYAHRHPGRYAAIQRPPDPHSPADQEYREHTDALLALVLTVLRGYDLDGDDAVHAARVLRSTLHGFVALEQLGGFGLPADLETSFDRAVDTIDAGLHAPRGKDTP
ncbi:TetR/AcrR family transcriptional regulator [Prauserella cavernicola]|uniref:WHG domain-containing protein n=1 Tax=Prauserella cavernicola TaxID=2800127 RepID=A0A934QPH6_9PSEU|nr:TetR-like C-terminal domain-containing protein [Prauserella cavernicola]MBK1783128.1 WHG domain-containing protein [Prauserella cavernicola]